MKEVKVYPVFHGDNGEPYFRTIPNGQLVCIIDGQWHTAVDDNTWNEPIAPLNMKNLTINIVNSPEEEE